METNHFQRELLFEINNRGIDFVHFVDISPLTKIQNKEFPIAILIGITLSKKYLMKVAGTPDYVEQMKTNKSIKNDEFYLTELKTDKIADDIEKFLISKGFKAYSQSEDNIKKTGFYDNEDKRTPLPHKTIAGFAGLGWIGKHNLLVTPKYGSALSMCSVLTNAPLESVRHEPKVSTCGDCSVCKEICKSNAIKGEIWEVGISREKIIDVSLCTTCFQCLVQCPWTQKYLKGKNK